MLQNAKNVLLSANPGTLENVYEALLDRFQKIKFTRVVKTVVNFDLQETLTTIDFLGLVQPLSPEQILMKPEGQRSWRWLQVHAYATLILVNDEIVRYDGKNYRVTANGDWSKFGMVEYHLCEDYRSGA